MLSPLCISEAVWLRLAGLQGPLHHIIEPMYSLQVQSTLSYPQMGYPSYSEIIRHS